MDLCTRCGYPLIFRNYWPANPHQPFHIPTGWPCWTLGQETSAPPAERIPFPRRGEVSETYWEPLKARGLELYRRYLRTGRMRPFLDLIRRELERGNSAMAENLIERWSRGSRPVPSGIVFSPSSWSWTPGSSSAK